MSDAGIPLETIASALRVSQLRARQGGELAQREAAATLSTLAGELHLRDLALAEADRVA